MLRFAFIAALALVFSPQPAEACTCRAPGPACEEMFRATVFVGRVTTIEGNDASAATTFELVETLHSDAPLGKTVTLHHMTDGNMCGIAFTKGKTYVVYAHGTAPDQLGAGACSRTHVAAKNEPDVAFAHEKPKRSTALIEGTVVLTSTGVSSPKAGIEVRAAGTTVTAKSDAKGAFKLAVPPGNYQLEPTDPALRLWQGRKLEVSVPAVAACAHPTVTVEWDGRIEGSVGVADVEVGAVAAKESDRHSRLSAKSDANGHYVIHGVPAGSFRVGVSLPDYGGVSASSPWPTTYYPDPVTVKQAALVSGIDFKLPAPTKVVTVRGRAATGAMVSIVPDGRNRSTSMSAMDGGFALTELAGENVVVRACVYGDPKGMSCTERKLTLAQDVVVDLTADAGR